MLVLVSTLLVSSSWLGLLGSSSMRCACDVCVCVCLCVCEAASLPS